VKLELDLFALTLLSVKCLLALFCLQFTATLPRKQPLARHLSFDQICEVATMEHDKLSSVKGDQHNVLGFFVVKYLMLCSLTFLAELITSLYSL